MNKLSWHVIPVYLFILFSGSTLHAQSEQPVTFSTLHYEKTPLYYKQNGKARQDLSAGAWSGMNIILAYDGGNNSALPDTRSYPQTESTENLTDIWQQSTILKRSFSQRDIEGGTWVNDSLFLTSSLSTNDEEMPGFRLLAELKMSNQNTRVRWERSVDLREAVLTALRKETKNDSAWFARIATSFGKRGGLNVEGLTYNPHKENTLILGLRSPLSSLNFGDKIFGSEFSLRNGKAMIVSVTKPFSPDPVFEVSELDLQGHGIRGIEYFPSLQGYIIIGGPVAKETDFSLWFYQLNGELFKLNIQGFDKLCRPETVIPTVFEGKPGIIIFSEESGKLCEGMAFNYIAATVRKN